MLKFHTPHAGTALPSDDEAKLTPLHFAARYLPRYQDDDAQQQDSQEEVEVTTLSSSKQAMKFLVTFCRVDVR